MNRYLEKIAKESKPSDETARNLGIAGIGAGALVAKHNYDRGNFTGRETLYHGTDTESAKKIREEGLKPNQTKPSVTKIVDMDLDRKNKNLVFTTRNKYLAKTYAGQQKAIAAGKVTDKYSFLNLGPKIHVDTALGKNNDGIVKFNVPTWKEGLRGARNPETKKLIRQINNPGFGNMHIMFASPSQKKLMKRNIYNTMESSSYIRRHSEGLGSEYIPKSKNYQRNTAKEVSEYIGHNKGRFLKGVGKTALPLAAGSAALAYHFKNKKE
jgi:hypothetical protein